MTIVVTGHEELQACNWQASSRYLPHCAGGFLLVCLFLGSCYSHWGFLFLAPSRFDWVAPVLWVARESCQWMGGWPKLDSTIGACCLHRFFFRSFFILGSLTLLHAVNRARWCLIIHGMHLRDEASLTNRVAWKDHGIQSEARWPLHSCGHEPNRKTPKKMRPIRSRLNGGSLLHPLVHIESFKTCAVGVAASMA